MSLVEVEVEFVGGAGADVAEFAGVGAFLQPQRSCVCPPGTWADQQGATLVCQYCPSSYYCVAGMQSPAHTQKHVLIPVNAGVSVDPISMDFLKSTGSTGSTG